jgi:hypothetical protein
MTAMCSAASGVSANGAMNDFDGPSGGPNRLAGTSVAANGSNRASGLKTAPPELLEFACAGSVRDAAHALGLSVGTVHQLRAGYWPEDPRRILRKWSEYKGRTGRIASSWFLRRVRAGGVVAHAGCDWGGVGLAQRVGELVAVARSPDGGLLAQTLELPAQRIPLEVRS